MPLLRNGAQTVHLHQLHQLWSTRVKNLLDGKRALVTGCNGRLGPIWIDALERAGAIVVGTDLPVDITNPDDVNRLVDHNRDLDILVNNAGVDSRPGDGGWDPMAAMLAVNVGGTALMIEKFAALTAVRTIVNIASLYGLVAPDLRYYNHRDDGWVKDPGYPASKAGVIALTTYYAASLAEKGIRVNALAPGGVVAGTDALTQGDPEFARKYTARIPMQRMCRPEDLAGPLVFLASDLSSFVTGHTIPIDGGYLCW
jgi:NAD(P)-dependent dehydrogenase (short-subunit alcohol dehydrogenase family)